MNEMLSAPASTWIFICLAAYAAGFIDSIVGGGGLVQTPVLLFSFPNTQVANLLGTTKIPSFCGTATAAWFYSKRVNIQWKLVGIIALAAFAAALLGSHLVTLVHNDIIKPVILIVLVAVAIYTYRKKDLGMVAGSGREATHSFVKGVVCGLVLGFYDGFIGPGTGSFLVLAFITLLNEDFLHANAHAKFVNLSTNLASILYFSSTGHIFFKLAIPMAVCNMLGGLTGSKLALLKGNRFIRVFFLLIVTAIIVRFAWDIFYPK
jgi:uncharacterized membrane protein YfcA